MLLWAQTDWFMSYFLIGRTLFNLKGSLHTSLSLNNSVEASDKASWLGSALFLIYMVIHIDYEIAACADLGSFARGDPTLKFFCCFFSWWGEGGSKYHYKRAIIGLPLNGVLLALCWWWPNIDCWLDSFVIFQVIWTSIAKQRDIFVIFQGGPDPLSLFWICPCAPPERLKAKVHIFIRKNNRKCTQYLQRK